MKNEETRRIIYYTSKKEVVYTSLLMCENAPPKWLHVPEEDIKRFQQSVRYKRADNKKSALEKFKITFQKQRLWNEVLKKNCELWRSEWAKMCNRHLFIDNQIAHRSYERQGKMKIPTIHEGVDARKIEEKYLTGQVIKGSWKVEENQMIKKQNILLQKVIATFGKVSGALSMWKEWLNDIRRKHRNNFHDGNNDYPNQRTAEYHGINASGNIGQGRGADVLSGAGRTIAAIRERINTTASNLAGYRRTADVSRRKDRTDTTAYKRESAMAEISTEVKQRKQSREHSSLKERLEENKKIVAERERENTHSSRHDRGISR